MAPQRVYDQLDREMRGNLAKWLNARRGRPAEDVAFEIRRDYITRVSVTTVRRWLHDPE